MPLKLNSLITLQSNALIILKSNSLISFKINIFMKLIFYIHSTALHTAVMENDKEIVEILLLNPNIDVNALYIFNYLNF